MIVDPNAGAREALGRLHPGASLHAELDADLLTRQATAAHVCTPGPTHDVLVRDLIAAGVHSLVEKPFAEDATATEALLSLASARDVLVCPVHQFPFQDGVRRLIEWLPSLGAVRHLGFSTCSAGASGDNANGLDGLVAEILPHPLVLASIVLKKPVAQAMWQVQSPAPGELFAAATLGTAAVTIAISAHGRPTENVLKVVGDRGTVTADLFHGFAVRQDGVVSHAAKIAHPFAESVATFAEASTNLLRRVVTREPAYPGLRELIRRFYAAVRGEGDLPLSSSTTLDVARARDTLLACLERVRRG